MAENVCSDKRNFSYRAHLLKIAGDLTSVDLDNLKFYFKDRIGIAGNDTITTSIELFSKLEQLNLLGPNNLKPLAEGFENISRPTLSQDLLKFDAWSKKRFPVRETGTGSKQDHQVLITEEVSDGEKQVDEYVTDGTEVVPDGEKQVDEYVTDEREEVPDGEKQVDECVDDGTEDDNPSSEEHCENTADTEEADKDKNLALETKEESYPVEPKDESLPVETKKENVPTENNEETPSVETNEGNHPVETKKEEHLQEESIKEESPSDHTSPVLTRTDTQYAEKDDYVVYISEAKHFQEGEHQFAQVNDGDNFSLELKNRHNYTCTVDVEVDGIYTAYIELGPNGSLLLEGNPYESKKFKFWKNTSADAALVYGDNGIVKCTFTPPGHKVQIQTTDTLRKIGKKPEAFIVSKDDTAESFIKEYSKPDRQAQAVYIDGKKLDDNDSLREAGAFEKEMFVLMASEEIRVQPPTGPILTMTLTDAHTILPERFLQLVAEKCGMHAKDIQSLSYRDREVTNLVYVLQDDPTIPIIVTPVLRNAEEPQRAETRGATRSCSIQAVVPKGMSSGKIELQGKYSHPFTVAAEEFVGYEKKKVIIEIKLVAPK